MNNNELAAFLRQQAELLYHMGSEAREKIEAAASALDSASDAVAAEREACAALVEGMVQELTEHLYRTDADIYMSKKYGNMALEEAAKAIRGPAALPSAGQVNDELLVALWLIAAYPNRDSESTASSLRNIARAAIASTEAACNGQVFSDSGIG
jgi:hypothetical protein